MDKELRKRLEEAAKNYADENYYVDYSAGTTPYSVGLEEGEHDGAEDGFLAGAEYGYKEAIALATEWLNNHLGKDNGTPYFIKAFEADMNKLWEEEK